MGSRPGVPLAASALTTLDVVAMPSGSEQETVRAEKAAELGEPAVVRVFRKMREDGVQIDQIKGAARQAR